MFWIKMKIAAAVLVGAAAVGGGGAAAIVAAAEPAVPKAEGLPAEASAKAGRTPVADSGVSEKGIECRVTELVPGGRVKLSAGSAQGVREKFEFDVSRDGKAVGAVKVVSVEEKQCTAEIASVTGEIKVGDAARTRFGTVLSGPGAKPGAPAAGEARIAWGEAVDGLQAGLVPLGGGAAADWGRDWLCAKCFKTVMEIQAARGPGDGPGKPPVECSLCGQKKAWVISTFGNAPVSLTHKVCPSCATAKRVCQGCGAAKPWGATFVEGDALAFEYHLRNVGDAALRALNAGPTKWQLTFVPKGGGVTRAARYAPQVPAFGTEWAPIPLAAGQHTVIAAAIDGNWQFDDATLERSAVPAPIKHLPAGRYTVAATYPGGKATTGAVEIEIRPKGAAASEFGEKEALELAARLANGKVNPKVYVFSAKDFKIKKKGADGWMLETDWVQAIQKSDGGGKATVSMGANGENGKADVQWVMP